MKNIILRKYILSLLCYVFLSFVFHLTPVYSEEISLRPAPARDIKGFWELNLYTQTTSRTVVEETGRGDNFEGDAETTRVMAKLATRPWHPIEFYLQAGTANLIIDDFDEYRGDYSLAYGGGISLTIYSQNSPRMFKVITQGDVLYFTTKDDNVLVYVCNVDSCNSENDLVADLAKEEIRWGEWTLTGMGIWRSQNWEPYAGVRFSLLDSKDKLDGPILGSRKISLEEDNNFGFVLGTNIYLDPGEDFAFNAEATFIDQFSIKIGIKLWY
ncbi:MAG TPA: hypothetical protein VFF47_04695 [Nitrospirota bacterium]|nr:hypothetical protein [Nitrospirota bacterium]